MARPGVASLRPRVRIAVIFLHLAHPASPLGTASQSKGMNSGPASPPVEGAVFIAADQRARIGPVAATLAPQLELGDPTRDRVRRMDPDQNQALPVHGSR